MASANRFVKAAKEGNYSDYLRVVMLGKTGNGKSSVSNHLVGDRVFKTGSNSNSITQTCEAVTFEMLGRKILLVDTPGRFCDIIYLILKLSG